MYHRLTLTVQSTASLCPEDVVPKCDSFLSCNKFLTCLLQTKLMRDTQILRNFQSIGNPQSKSRPDHALHDFPGSEMNFAESGFFTYQSAQTTEPLSEVTEFQELNCSVSMLILKPTPT